MKFATIAFTVLALFIAGGTAIPVPVRSSLNFPMPLLNHRFVILELG